MPDLKEDLLGVLDGYLREVRDHVLEVAGKGGGTEVLGRVPGRPEAEDVEIGLDRSCQDILERWLANTGLRIDVYSEHGLSRLGGGEGEPQILAATDPFDGSGLFSRGISADWWSVTTMFEPVSLTPVAAGAIDVLRGDLYLADEEGVTVRHLDGGQATAVRPSDKKALGGDTILATYLLSPLYQQDWLAKAGGFVRTVAERWPSLLVWANGGSHIYPWLARGVVHAYVMFSEPRSEIDPGLGFARAAGCPVYSVEDDGSLAPYRFVAGEQAGRVPFFIAACTPELAESIVAEIRRSGDLTD